MLPSSQFTVLPDRIECADFLSELQNLLQPRNILLKTNADSSHFSVENPKKKMFWKSTADSYGIYKHPLWGMLSFKQREFMIPPIESIAQKTDGSLSRLQAHRFIRDLAALLLTIDGDVVLHGNVLLSPAGVSFVLLGESGRGKSTLSMALMAAGATLISDDLCAFSPKTGKISFHSNIFNLSESTFEALSLVQAPAAKNTKLCISVSKLDSLPLGLGLDQFYTIDPSATEISRERMKPAISTYELMRSAIIDFRELGLSLDEYSTARAEVASKVPMTRLGIPRGLANLEKVCRLLLS